MMMNCMLAVLLAGAGGDSTPPAAETVLRTYDLGALGHATNAVAPIRDLFPAAHQRLDAMNGYPQSRVVEGLDAEDLVMALSDLLGDEIAYEASSFLYDDRELRLVLRAPESAHQVVGGILDVASSLRRSDRHLDIDLIRLPAGTGLVGAAASGSVIPEDAAQQLIEQARQAGVVESHRIQLSSAGRGKLVSIRHQAFAGDHDVEIAQRAFAVDTILHDLVTGLRLDVRATPAGEATRLGLILSHGAALGEAEEIEVPVTGLLQAEEGKPSFITGAETAERMEALQQSLCLQTALSAGQALLLRSQQDLTGVRGTTLIVIRIAGTTPPAVRSQAITGSPFGLTVLQRSAFQPPRFEFGGVLMEEHAHPHAWPLRSYLDEGPLEVRWASGDEGGVATDWIRSTLPGIEEMSEPSTIGASAGAWEVLLHGASEAGDRSRDSVMLEALVPEAEVVQLALSARRNGEGSGGLELELPLVVGEVSAVSVGVEVNVFRKAFVEVAEGASVADPAPIIELDGAVLMLRPLRLPDGGLQLEVRGSIQLRRGQREYDTQGRSLPPCELSDWELLTIRETLDLSGGEAIVGRTGGGESSGAIRFGVQVR